MKKETPWQSKAICGDSSTNFFSEADLPDTATEVETDLAILETIKARSICVNCPVRRECLVSAIDNKDRYGVWGGADQTTIRKALSIDENGNAVPRARDMICPYCYSKDISIRIRRRNQTQIQCPDCNLMWWAAKPVSPDNKL